MNRNFTLIIFFSFILYSSLAQTEQQDSLELSSRGKIMPYISITSPFENYSSFDIGILKPTVNGNAFGLELGYIYEIEVLNSTIEDSWYENIYGAKAYFYFRLFLDEIDPYPLNSKTFIDFEPQFYWASFESENDWRLQLQ